MKQLRAFNRAKAGKTPLFCLQNVRMGYQISSLYNDAWQAWRNAPQFTSAIPKGVDVPIYFEFWVTIDKVYKNWGHIAVSLADGRIWTDGRYYSSVKELNDKYLINGKSKYVGWSTEVNKVKVIERSQVVTDNQKLTSAPVFDPAWYRKRYPDLGRNGVNTNEKATAHWLRSGLREGRQSNANFHVTDYRANYGDLRRVFGADNRRTALHWFNHGIKEGRKGIKSTPTIIVDKSHEVIDKIVNYAKGLK